MIQAESRLVVCDNSGARGGFVYPRSWRYRSSLCFGWGYYCCFSKKMLSPLVM